MSSVLNFFQLKNMFHIFRGPILVCIGMQEKDSSWESAYQLWPHGVCHRVVAHNTPLNPAMWTDLTARIAESWPYPFEG